MYLATALGITVGYHRLFTHRSFSAPAAVRFVLGVLGSMAVEGPVIQWVAEHRKHHQHSDGAEDPHSPHAHGEGTVALLKGFFHAHLGWMLIRPAITGLARYVPDLHADRTVRWVSRLFPLWAVLGLLIPAGLGGLLTLSWMGVLLGFLWGGLVRIFLVHHITWSVNSVCHLWGTRPFNAHDHSRNNVLMGILALGEGWHNNHHAFPASARHGLRWWQLDLSYLVIRLLVLCRLASEVRVPSPERIAAKRD
jgi:stearoyl-CoA desaturase (delta-9 desaturase)